MLNLIWLALLVSGVVTAALTNHLDAVTQGALGAAKSAVMDVALPLVGAMALWLGLLRLAEKAGLISRLARAILPLMRVLFPEIPRSHPALGAMMMSISANMLGVSNAATPLGLKAMADLNSLNPRPGVATNAMCTFLALNTSAIQLVPATAITILTIKGGKNPTAIVGSTLLSTTIATVAAVIIVKALERLPPFRWENQPEISPSPPPGPTAVAVASGSQAQPMSAPGRIALLLLGAFFLIVFIRSSAPAFNFGNGIAGVLSGIPGLFKALANLAIPFILTFFPVYAAARKIEIFPEFVEGAKEGFQVALRIIPYLVAMLVAIVVFRESGALGLLQQAFRPVLEPLGLPADLLPMILMRPLSGSGSIAVLNDIAARFGPDNLITYMAATIYGSAETTFYVVAVYFGSVGVVRTRHAIPAGLLADLVGVFAAVSVCRLLFS
jgi:spore maturation protein SpmA